MSIKRKRSVVSLFRRDPPDEQDTGTPAGPSSSTGHGPSSTTWRRRRLMEIGADETTALTDRHRMTTGASYGTLPSLSPTRSRFPARLPIPSRRPSDLSFGGGGGGGGSLYSAALHSPSEQRTFRARTSLYFSGGERPIPAYDAPLLKDLKAVEDAPPLAAQVNGLRVWYASFTSIDWLHDSIKDAVRRARMHSRRSLKGRAKVAGDRLVGWLIVTIVGFLTALAAFGIVRLEMTLFDLKEGYCSEGWWKARRFCCPGLSEEAKLSSASYDLFSFIKPTGLGNGRLPNFNTAKAQPEELCDAWTTWAQVFGHAAEKRGAWMGFKAEMVEYIAYTCIALILASAASLMTIHLTASTSFQTRKESAVTGEPDEVDAALQGPPRKTLYYASGSGISEVKTVLSGYVIHGYLGGRTLFTKSFGLALSVASGLTLGKEGPFVHIASCIGNIVSRGFRKYDHNEGKRREILSAACAAGVAVAFGAPIGGVLFSLEEVSYYFPAKVMWKTFFCAAIAAGSLKFLDPFGTGKLVLFQVSYDKDWHAAELVPFVLLGVFGGLYGAVFTNLNVKWATHVRGKTWMRTHPVWEVLMITLLTTALCFLNPFTRMGGTELVATLFAECRTGLADHSGLCVLDPATQAWPVSRAILTALLVKGLLTVVTFGIKLPAGIFVPTLGVGACAGRILGIVVQYAYWAHPDARVFRVCGGDLDCVIPGLYAMVGAAAALSGVTRTTVSLVVIMFELTDTLTYVVPLMIAVLVAKTVADALEPKGIYDLVIEMNQLPFLDAKHDYLWGEYELQGVADVEVPILRTDETNTVRHVRDQLIALVRAGYDDGVIPILRGERLVGVVGAHELEHALSIVADEPDKHVRFGTLEKTHVFGEMSVGSLGDEVGNGPDPYDFGVYMDQAPLTVHHFAPLELVHQFFAKLGARYVVVTDPEGAYEGVIDKTAWLAFLEAVEHGAHHH